MSFSMLQRLVQSAFQTGYLSVESEGLIRQMLNMRSYQTNDLSVLQELEQAIHAGAIKREAHGALFLIQP